MARHPHALLSRRRRRGEVVRRHRDKIDMVSIAGVMCRCISNDKDGYVFQAIAEPTLHFALTPEEYDDQINAQIVRPARKD